MERELFVYMDRDGTQTLVGRLWTRAHQSAESATFLYDADWLRHLGAFASSRTPFSPALGADWRLKRAGGW